VFSKPENGTLIAHRNTKKKTEFSGSLRMTDSQRAVLFSSPYCRDEFPHTVGTLSLGT
jgi:hypothetical protein